MKYTKKNIYYDIQCDSQLEQFFFSFYLCSEFRVFLHTFTFTLINVSLFLLIAPKSIFRTTL